MDSSYPEIRVSYLMIDEDIDEVQEREALCHGCGSSATYVKSWQAYDITIEYRYECDDCACRFTERDYLTDAD